MTDRRSFIKGLVGVPLALLAGGTIINDAVTLEEHGETGLVVPTHKAPVTEPVQISYVTLSSNEGVVLPFQQTNYVIVPEGQEAWIHVENQGAYAMIGLTVMRGGDQFSTVFTGQNLSQGMRLS